MARTRPDRHAAVVVCVPGLEAVVAAELEGLGIPSRPAGTGALAARMTDRQLYLANVGLASATRVLVDAGQVTARSFAALEDRLAEVDVARWVAPGSPVRVRVTSHRSRLLHTGAIEERMRRVLALGAVPPAGEEAALLVVRVDHDRVSVRVDSSGAPLHERGWRGPAAKAPLRETLAAAMLTASGWGPGRPLVDPFCGSGTVAIEAARRAAGLAPGADRSFAFESWPSFAPGTWASVRAEVDGWRTAASASPPAPIVARDRDAGAVAATGENAVRAGVADLVDVDEAAVSALVPPDAAGAGAIVTNPPWGGRLRGGDLRDLYARLGQVARGRFPGWTLAVLTSDPSLSRAIGGPGEVRLRTRSGGTAVHLDVRTVPPG
jgi:putative N6-adenine-specific DNA methylase